MSWRWKSVVFATIVLLGVVYALPNLFPERPIVQISPEAGTVSSFPVLKERVQSLLAQAQLRPSAVQVGTRTLILRFQAVESQLRAKDILSTALGDQYMVAVNLMPTTPRLLQRVGARPMRLGLDLSGGVHFGLSIDVDSLKSARLSAVLKDIHTQLDDAKLPYVLTTAPADVALLKFPDRETQESAVKLLREQFPELTLRTQRLAHQTLLQIQLSEDTLRRIQQQATEQTMITLANRVNELGVAEPIIQQEGNDRIVVDLPGVQDITRAQQILGGTATIAFHLADRLHDLSITPPPGTQRFQYQARSVLLHKPVVLSGAAIVDATAGFGANGDPAVNLTLSGGAERFFHRFTSRHIGEPLAIVYSEVRQVTQWHDGKRVKRPQKMERVIMIARIDSALTRHFQITGLASFDAARDLALLLRSGSLPAPIYIVEQTTIGPQLGSENIRRGLSAIACGFFLACGFMVAYYHRFGWIAVSALVANLVLLVAVVSLLGMTLTLPGMAGILLTVAMAVDADVLIFERIREELRCGASPKAAIQTGYARAWTTILDANLTTLIAAGALFWIGAGSVRGFAVTLMLGLGTSMLTAVGLSRLFVDWRYGKRGRKLQNLPIGL